LASSSPLYNDLRRDYCISPSFCLIKLNASPILNAFPAYIHILLALRRFERTILALQNIRTSFRIRIISYVKTSIFLANCLIIWKTLVGELLWYLTIRFRTKSDCDIVLIGLYNVWKIYRSASRRRGLVGVDIYNLTSSFDMIA